jgi:DNA polymerase I-like protein with 3'-5' exonuclease and polymerase domains
MRQISILRTNAEVRQLVEYLSDKDIVVIDTETTGVTEESEIIGYAICADTDVAYYVVTAYWDVETKALVYLETKDTAPTVMRALKGKRLVGHNIMFDVAMIHRNYGVLLLDEVFCDTMILAHLLDENRKVGLKELGASFYGAEAKKEQEEMKASVIKNGGVLTKELYELYKGDSELIAKYGAQDVLLTWNLFYDLIPQLYEEKLDKFFFDDECMPLLKTATYDMNTTGMKIDLDKLDKLRRELEIEMLELKDFVYKQIDPHVKDKYPGTNARNAFNINSSNQIAWLLCEKLGNTFPYLTDAGLEVCEALGMKRPYTVGAKKEFIAALKDAHGRTWREPNTVWDKKTKKYKGKGIVKDYWTYVSTDKEALSDFAAKYKWVEKLLEYKALDKILTTYVLGIQKKVRYGIIHPNFLQHGTTSGRYSCKEPNFQNLPRNDKRVKACVVSRPGKVFVGADESQLEPRVFASTSGDETLMGSFAKGEDFYSVVGAPVYGKTECSLYKDQPNSFAVLYPKLRDIIKAFSLATPYGTSAFQQSVKLKLPKEECQDIIDRYFAKYPKVELMMLESHEQAKQNGVVYSLFGRPRRIPEAKNITKRFGTVPREELPYEARTLLNLGMNHRVQSTAASIMNRSAIRCVKVIREMATLDPRWNEVKLVLQVHDELVLEGPEELGEDMCEILKTCMETTVTLPGVALVAVPKIATNLADLK